MALNIKNERAEQLARELAHATGESLTEAITTALAERLSAVRRRRDRAQLSAEIAALQAFVASLPDLDSRSPDEILGYDERGLPH